MPLAEINELARPLVQKLLNIQARCPACGAEMSEKVRRSFMAGQRVKCNGCEFYGTWRFGTLLAGSRINDAQFLGLFFKYTIPNDAPAIARHLHLDPSTVREWREKILIMVHA